MLDPPPIGDRQDALAPSSRARLFNALASLRRSASTAELARLVGKHPNGVRTHLQRLERAGLVVRARSRPRRGRPADLWLVAPGAQPGGQAPQAYEELSRWLARFIGARPATTSALERAGRTLGRELAPVDAAPGSRAVQDTLSTMGFAPSADVSEPCRVTLRLDNCPYREVARVNQPAVCALHKGITQGLLDVLAPGVGLASFEPRDPDEAGCMVELTDVGVELTDVGDA